MQGHFILCTTLVQNVAHFTSLVTYYEVQLTQQISILQRFILEKLLPRARLTKFVNNEMCSGITRGRVLGGEIFVNYNY